MKKNTKKGFTLVELLVVIAILAILASVAVVGYTAFIDKAEKSNAETELHQIVEYINAELMDDGEWKYSADAAALTKDNIDTATLQAALAATTDLAGFSTKVSYDATNGVVYTYDTNKTVSEKLR